MAGGTSRTYLLDRLNRAGRADLLNAIANGDLSVHGAAAAAGFVRQRPTLGGTSNQARRRHWATMRATGQAPPLEEPKSEPTPTAPTFTRATRKAVEQLIAAGRGDLAMNVLERKISPWQAQRIADRSMRRHAVFEDRKVEERPKPKKPPPFDPTVLIP
jgi:hypothetical protein